MAAVPEWSEIFCKNVAQVSDRSPEEGAALGFQGGCGGDIGRNEHNRQDDEGRQPVAVACHGAVQHAQIPIPRL